MGEAANAVGRKASEARRLPEKTIRLDMANGAGLVRLRRDDKRKFRLMARLPRPQQAQRIGFSWRERLLVALVAALLAGLLWGGGGMFLSSVTQDFEKN